MPTDSTALRPHECIPQANWFHRRNSPSDWLDPSQTGYLSRASRGERVTAEEEQEPRTYVAANGNLNDISIVDHNLQFGRVPLAMPQTHTVHYSKSSKLQYVTRVCISTNQIAAAHSSKRCCPQCGSTQLVLLHTCTMQYKLVTPQLVTFNHSECSNVHFEVVFVPRMHCTKKPLCAHFVGRQVKVQQNTTKEVRSVTQRNSTEASRNLINTNFSQKQGMRVWHSVSKHVSTLRTHLPIETFRSWRARRREAAPFSVTRKDYVQWLTL